MIWNHFELDELTIIKNTNVVSISDIREQVKLIETEGRNHFTLFQKKKKIMMAKIQITTTIKNNSFLILNGEMKTKRCSKALPSSTSNKLKFKTSHFSQLIEKYVWKKTPWYRT